MAKILIIDDDINTTYLLNSVFSKAGYEVHAVNHSETALSDALFIKPDLILLDLMMPGMDGIGICEILNSSSELKQVPILVLSAVGDIKSKLAAFKVGAKDFITKPVHVEELKSRVNIWINHGEN